MKNGEIIQLYIFLNEFKDEYVKEDDLKLNTCFEAVADYIDGKLQYPLKEVEHTKL